jgi:Arc/MetJ-type ribon-helix-helix transcriptional regulator
MTITVVLKDEVAEIVERHVADGRYPDAESAVAAALTLLEDVALDWSDVDAAAVQRMIAEAEAEAEGGEYPFDDAARRLDAVIEAARRR